MRYVNTRCYIRSLLEYIRFNTHFELLRGVQRREIQINARLFTIAV